MGGKRAKGPYVSRKLVRPEHVGLGFLMSWVYCSWFSPSLFRGAVQATRNDVSWIISLAVCVATIFAVSLALGRSRLSSRRGICPAAAIGTAIATVLESASEAGAASDALMWMGSVSTGLFSGLLWILWSEHIGASDEDAVRSIALPAALAALLCFAFSYAIPWPVSVLFVAALPVVSGILLSAAAKGRPPLPRPVIGSRPDGSSSLIVKVFLVSFLVSAISSFAWSTAPLLSEAEREGVLFFGVVGGMAIMFMFCLPSALTRRAPNVARSYRMLILLLIVSLALLIQGGSSGRAVAEVFLVALSLSFDFFILVYFGSYASRRFSHSERALCYCEGVINLGIAVGAVGGLLFAGAGQLAVDHLESAYLCLIVVAVLALICIVEQQINIERLVSASTLQDACDALQARYGLSAREREIVELLGQGRSVPYISGALFLAKSTVETHRKHIYEKMGVHGRQELLDAIGECRSWI